MDNDKVKPSEQKNRDFLLFNGTIITVKEYKENLKSGENQ